MARSQTWTRNISKKVRQEIKPGQLPSIVNNEALEGMKRRAEKLGLIVHGQSPKQARQKKGNK